MPSQHSGPVLAQRDGLTVIDCRACGWAHLDPLPVVEDAYYRDTFWSEKGAGWLAKYEAERDWLDMRNGDWLSVVEEHLGSKHALLDVGCGYGFFMNTANKLGWPTYGIEPSIEAAQYARQFGSVADCSWVDYNGNDFDCISALWLLEHLPNPFEFLAWARAHLAPGGVLLLCVPQEWTDIQARANDKASIKNYWLHPTHLNYWSTATLYGMLGRAGFRVVDALASFPMENFILAGTDYTADEKLGDREHAWVRGYELSLPRDQRLTLQRGQARYSMGRDLVVVCK